MTRLLIRLCAFVAVLFSGVNNGFATSICWKATALINGQLSWSTPADNKQYVEEAKRLGLDCRVKSNEAFNLDVASNCLLDPNECTTKGLCEVATEVTNGNKLWSTSTTSNKHVSFA